MTSVSGSASVCPRANTLDRRQLPRGSPRMTIRSSFLFRHTASVRPCPSIASPSGVLVWGLTGARVGRVQVPFGCIRAVCQTSGSLLGTYSRRDAVALVGADGQAVADAGGRRQAQPGGWCPDACGRVAPALPCAPAAVPLVHHDRASGAVDADLRGVAVRVGQPFVRPDGDGDGGTAAVHGDRCLGGDGEVRVEHGRFRPGASGWSARGQHASAKHLAVQRARLPGLALSRHTSVSLPAASMLN